MTVGLCAMGFPFRYYKKGGIEKYREFVGQYYAIGRKFNDVDFFDDLLVWVQPIGQGGCPDFLTERLYKKYNKDYIQPGY